MRAEGYDASTPTDLQTLRTKRHAYALATDLPPPLAQARPRSQKSSQNGGSTPTPCLDKAVHAHDTRDSKRVGAHSDGDGEGLRMGKSTLSKAALPISHVLQMDVNAPMTRGTKNIGRYIFPSAPNVRNSHAGNNIVSHG